MTDMSGASSRAPTSAEIDAVIAAAIANAPPPPPSDFNSDSELPSSFSRRQEKQH